MDMLAFLPLIAFVLIVLAMVVVGFRDKRKYLATKDSTAASPETKGLTR